MIKVVKNILEANCITHSGTMHADEVFASAFLELYLGDRKVFRTSNIEGLEIPKDAIIYDVGCGKFDHHQIDMLKRPNDIPYCSLGLLWKEYGKDYLKKEGIIYIDEVFEGIDKDLIEGIDADDNGVFPKIEANYKVKTLPGIIKLFNPGFDSYQDESIQFEKAVSIAMKIFEEEMIYINGKVIADKKVHELLEDVSLKDKYLILDHFLPYEETVLNCSNANNILFVAFPSNRGGYAIKTVPKSLVDKSARLDFPIEWAGLSFNELENVSGIKGLTFCHNGRFIVNCKDRSVVLKVLEKLCK